ncbi:MAG TPA: hypothetical protein ENF81_07510 [Thermotogaceae bacterium]|nr:hypothetical protein [Thermotogaceae bacterium]
MFKKKLHRDLFQGSEAELWTKTTVLSAKSTERHVELVQLAFTVWMLKGFSRETQAKLLSLAYYKDD